MRSHLGAVILGGTFGIVLGGVVAGMPAAWLPALILLLLEAAYFGSDPS